MCPPPPDASLEAIASAVVQASWRIYRDVGPGLLESVYELLLATRLEERGLRVERQRALDLSYRGLTLPGAFRVDLLVDRRLVVEVKAAERMPPVAVRQTLTYLRLLNLPLGLIVNFGGADFSGAVRRVVNNHHAIAGSPLRIHRPLPATDPEDER
jgi:iron complex transport system substrate-binding protein